MVVQKKCTKHERILQLKNVDLWAGMNRPVFLYRKVRCFILSLVSGACNAKDCYQEAGAGAQDVAE